MDRREAIKLTSLFLGGTIIGSEFFLAGCATDKTPERLISEADINLLNEIAETILPETEDSPGAKAANIGEFMSLMVQDCYSEEEHEIFIAGIKTINNRSVQLFSLDFVKLQPSQKQELLIKLDEEARNIGNHYFTMMKQLTVLGYFTSEPGTTIALKYNPIPGEFKGCIPYEEGDKIFANRI